MSKLLLTVMLVVASGPCWSGVVQQAAPQLPVYDAVVIKLNQGVSGHNSVNMDDSTFRAENVTLKHLLVIAYGIRDGLLFGLPKWAGSVPYDITAKVTDPDLKLMSSLSRDQRRAMLAAVLVSRFHLQTHIEVKTLPVYELVIAKGGPKLKISAVPQDPANPDHPGLGSFEVHNTDITAVGVTLSDLAGNLSFPLGRTVIDKTGLTRRYDFELRWTADAAANGVAESGAADVPPDIFTAIQAELGLKLQPAKGPVRTLVVDHVEQPSED